VSSSHQDTNNHLDNRYGTFQDAVSEYLIRHRSVLDIVSKLQEADARINRSIVKAITSCGCIEVNASKQKLPTDATYWDMKKYMDTHLKGQLCDQCLEMLETELGRSLFYVAALCNLFNLNLAEVIEKETRRVTALGMFNLT
jgi:hypothetical protein